MELSGDKACPNEYNAIYDDKICEDASNILGLPYQQSENFDGSDPRPRVCYLCRGCNQKTTRMSIYYGEVAKWICQRGKY